MSEIRAKSPVAQAIGSCLRGARDGDKNVRRRIQGWLAFLTGGGFAVFVALKLVNLMEDQIRNGWQQDVQDRHELVEAIKDQTTEIKNLVSEIKEDRMWQRRDHAVMIDRLRRNKPLDLQLQPDQGGGG